MLPVDDDLYRQLLSRKLWEAPRPLLAIARVQQALALGDGHSVADWLRAQGASLACDRMSRWLASLAQAEVAGDPATGELLVRDFRERALMHLRNHLEEGFEGKVYPLLHACYIVPIPESGALRTAAAPFLELLEEVGFPSRHGSAFLEHLFPAGFLQTVPEQEGGILAGIKPRLLDLIWQALAEKYPERTLDQRWRMSLTAVALAQSLAAALEAGWERFIVRGLFTKANGGEVRDLWVYIAPREHGGAVPGRVTHHLALETDRGGRLSPDAMAFERSLSWAEAAAQRYLHDEHLYAQPAAIHLSLDERESLATYGGPSLGFAVALVIIARMLNRRINRHVAVTGELRPDGSLVGVQGLTGKLKAVMEHNRCIEAGLLDDVPITDVVLPEDNRDDVDPDDWRAQEVQLHFAATLREALQSHMLIDPWERVLQALTETATPSVRVLPGDAADIEFLHRTILMYPFSMDGEALLETLAQRWAAQRRRGGRSPVPVPLTLLPFARHCSIEHQVLQQLRPRVLPTQRDTIDLALILHELRRGEVRLLFSGLDDLDKSDPPPPFLRELLAQLSNPPYAGNPAIFACRQSTWEWAERVFEQAKPPFECYPLSAGRSTFLDSHHHALAREAAGRLAACRIGWSQRGHAGKALRLPTLEEFFYGGTAEFPEALYVNMAVREIFLDGTLSEPYALSQVVASTGEEGLRAILLGGAGTGKSTELLKLCFDCYAGDPTSPLRERYVPVLLELKGKFDRHGRDTYEDFLECVLDDLRLSGFLSDEELEDELRYTPRLLVLLDGLDDIKPEGIEARDAIAESLLRFIRTLHPTSCVVVASRAHERRRAHESFLRYFDRYQGWLRMFRLEDLALDAASLRRYLERITLRDTELEPLLEAIGGNGVVLTNPMLLHLLSSTALQWMEDRPLTPGTLYRATLQRWLDEEIHARGKPRLAGIKVPAGKSFVQVMLGLWGVLSRGMLAQGCRELAYMEAREVLAHFLAKCLAERGRLPGWWPLSPDGRRQLGVEDDQIHADDLDTILLALSELCVMQ